jgi:uncharacterized protein (TIGR03083 family)
VELSAYLEYLRSDGDALAAAASRAPAAHIRSCPDWDMTALVTHTGVVHRWVEQIVSTRSAKYVKFRPPPFDGPESVLEWYRAGLDRVLATLAATDPDEAVWNWFDRGPAPARFWFRRMAHETAIHRWDAEAGASEPHAIGTDLAVDGIDEFLGFANQTLAAEPVAGLQGSLHLHATDADGEWSITVSPDHLAYAREHAKGDAALRGPVSDLLLWLLNRVGADAPSLQAFGDPELIELWRQIRF